MKLFRRLGSKRVLCMSLLVVVGLFWGGGEVFAQDFFGQSLFGQSGGLNTERIQTADAFLKMLYLIMRPLLALAGAALDNSLVFGEAFQLDHTLWKFWQLMRTFTMFTIGFIFIGTILYSFFNPNNAQENIKNVVVRSLIATFLVNVSRWIVAALIDLSTIAVVAIGMMPLNVMGDAETIKDIRFMTSHSYYDRVESNETTGNERGYSTIYSCEEAFFLPCWFDFEEVDGGDNISGLVPLTSEGTANVAAYEEQVKAAWGTQWDTLGPPTINKEYCVFEGGLIKYEAGIHYNECEQRNSMKQDGRNAMRGPEDGQFNCSKFSDLSKKAANSSGPLFTLYGSIFAMSNLPATTNFGNTGEVAIEMLMKIVVGFGLVIPLIAFAAVLIIRVVVLWLIIAFSPLLIMAFVYDFKKITEVAEGKFDLKNIISLLMMPVLGVFAISISIVFLSVLGNVDYLQMQTGEPPKYAGECHDNAATALGFNSIELGEPPEEVSEKNTKCYEFLGIQTICFSEGTRVFAGNVANTMVRLVTNGLGIALMWFAVFAVLKSNKFTEGTVQGIQDLATTVLKTTPIIPVPGGGSVGVGAVSRAASNLSRKIPQKMINDAYNQPGGLGDRVNKGLADRNGVDEEVIKQIDEQRQNNSSSWIGNRPKISGSEVFNFDDLGSKELTKKMSDDVIRDIRADRASYPDDIEDDIGRLGSANSFKDLMSNRAFTQWALKNNYYDNFTKDRNPSTTASKTQWSQGVLEGLAAQSGGVSGVQNTESNGVSKQQNRYFHNGVATRVQVDTRTGVVDYLNDEGMKSFSVPGAQGSETPTAATSPQNGDEVGQVIEFYNAFNGLEDYTTTFQNAELGAPYANFINGINNEITESPQSITREVGDDTVILLTESQTGEGGQRRMTSLRVESSSTNSDSEGDYRK